ncbi:MAG: hypothetical protein ACSHX9_04610 [Luteolibacter sp.]
MMICWIDATLLAASGENSAAYKAGEITGMLLSVVIMVSIPVLFIVSLVKLIRTRNKGWLAGLIVSSIPILAFIGLVFFGAYQAFTGKHFKTPVASISSVSGGRIDVPDASISVELPSGWKEIGALNDESLLSAVNQEQGCYMVVLADSEVDYAGTLRDFSDLTSEAMVDRLIRGIDTGAEELEVNSLPVIRREISGVTENVKIRYLHVSIYAGGYFHQVLCWSASSKWKSALPEFEKIVEKVKMQ